MDNDVELTIPEIFQQTVEFIGSMKDQDFEELATVLEQVDPSVSMEMFVSSLSDIFPTPGGPSVAVFIEFALSTRRLSEAIDGNVRSVAEAIRDASNGTDDLSDRIHRILTSRVIALREKSIGLTTDTGPRITDVRCLSDLRPVFASSDETDDIAGFVVMHTLRLNVAGSTDSVLHLSLDHDALVSLSEAVQRALDKDERLSGLVSELGVPDLSVRSL